MVRAPTHSLLGRAGDAHCRPDHEVKPGRDGTEDDGIEDHGVEKVDD